MMMDAGIRSSEASRSVVKSRNSSGCLIIRKKVDGMGGAGASGLRKVLEPTKEKKRPRLVLSDSGSSDEVSEPPRRKVTSREDRCDNGFKTGVVIESELRRKRIERVADELMSKRASNKLNVSDFDIYDGYKRKQPRKEYLDDVRTAVGGNGYLKASVVSGSGREFHDGSGRQDIVYKRKNSHFVSPNAVVGESGRGSDHAVRNRHEMKRDGAKVPGSLFKENLMDVSDVPIRFQGKNGVLKVMPNKKKGSGIMKTYDRRRPEENKRGSSSSNAITPSGLIQPSLHSETKMSKKETSFVKSENNMLDIQDSLPTNKSNSRDRGSEDSGKSLKRTKNVEDHKHLSGKSLKRTKNVEDHKHSKLMKKSKDKDLESGDSGKSLKLRRKKAKDQQSLKMSKDQAESAPASDKTLLSSGKEVKIKRGSGTEKQQLREQIRKMLIDAGWTIDYRPRRNRDYQDAVYVSPFGTAYWSIIKAYDALQKHFKEENSNSKTRGECPFIPISEQVLSKLTRQTRKKIEKQMKKRHLDGNKIKNLQGTTANEVESSENDSESVDSDEAEEKLSSFIKHGCKSLKSRLNGDSIGSPNNECQSIGHNSHEENRSNVQGRQSRKLGRCTLLVRNTNKVLNSETDGYIPYTGKRTVLSWLIDSGTVELREKVQYMNRQNTRIKLVGWITRDGIHCGCCSKILTVARFEIHAGSKLHQPFQYICLESGISLLQCQIDAWNRQEESKRCNFHTIDVDGDDPNDDTCGICGDGGDLICCDGCPSTYHQNCLGIHMLPAGDWHCPNCTCKFCGMAGEGFGKGIDITGSTLIMCSLCERKYHQSCSHDVGPLPSKTTELCPSFCGHKCKELFEQVQKFLGVRHELESGFSWSLVHRLDINSDASGRCLPQRVECNSKLAVALTVMDECFLPIVDRRGGINVIHNVLYNCGSNFNRLNYGGFYTAILERGDEILSAASLRFHGTQLAEMPFIGTRHIYRRQGMCRRLFRAIESALRSFKVEKLVIPAVSELMHTWTGVFGFKPLEESDKKEIGSLNLLVFPDIDMLQKHLTEPTNTMQGMTLGRGAKTLEVEGKQFGTPCSLGEPDEGTPTKEDRNNANMREADGINGKVVASDPGRTLGNISALFGPPNASSQEARPPTSDEEDVLFPSCQTKSLAAEAAVKSVHQLPTWISQAVPGEQTDLPLCSSSQGDTQSTLQGGFESNFHSLERSSSHAGDDKSDEIPRIKSKSLSPSDTTRSVSEMQKKSVLGSPDGEIVGHEDASVLRSSAEISASKMEEIVRP